MSVRPKSSDTREKEGGGMVKGREANEKTDGYPIKDATHIALETTRQFLEQDNTVRLAS